jgi:hypothetical protein
MLYQECQTQMGLWATFEKNVKFFDFLCQIMPKTEVKIPKYRKIVEFRFKIGPQKFPFWLRVDHPSSISWIMIFFLELGWPTQIDLWAAFEKNFQKYWLFGPNFDKNCEKTLKISKNH